MITDLGLLLAKAYQEFVCEMHDSMAGQGFDDLGRSDGFVFRALAQKAVTVSDLALRLDVSKQGAAQIVDDMQGRGYVRRTTNPADARARPVELTQRGRAALTAASTFHQEYEMRLAAAHGARNTAALRNLLTAMSGGADAAVDPRLRAMYL